MAAARYKDRTGNKGVSYASLASRARAEAGSKAVALLQLRLALYEACAWHAVEARVAREAAALVATGTDACAALRRALRAPEDATLDGVLGAIDALFAANRREYTATPAMHRAVEAAMQGRWRTAPAASKDHVEEVATAIEAGLEPEMARMTGFARGDAVRLRRWASAQWVRGVRQRAFEQQARDLRARLAVLEGNAMRIDDP